MKKRISAVCAALLMTASMLSACGKPTDDSVSEETTINIIQDGTQAPVGDGSEESSPLDTSSFVDPGASIDFGGEGEEEATAPDVEAETNVYVDQEAIENLIGGGVVTEAEKTPVLTEYNIDYKTRYGYNTLNEQEKALYAAMLEGAKSLATRVPVDDTVSNEMWLKVYGCLYMQEPQLFWLTSKRVVRGSLWYWETDTDIIASMQKEINAKASEVLAKAEGKDTFGKLKVFHDYIVLGNEFVREEGFNQTVYGGLVRNTVQCEGYAKTMQYLCDMAGIESMVVVGTNDADASHAWNVVKVDGEWYNLDCTWDDPVISENDKNNIRYRYFLVPDEWIHNKTHFNVNKKITGTQVKYFDPPACTATKSNYFTVTNQVYSDTASAEAALKEKLKTSAENKVRSVEIRVSDKSVYDAINSNLTEYAKWIKGENSSVSVVKSNLDPNTLIIQLDLIY